MATPAQIEQQVELERRAIRQGTQRLWSNTFELEQKSYASASIYGVTCIQAMLPKLVSYIDETAFARIQKGDNGLLFAEINAYLLELDTYSMAAIALKIAFDKIFSHKANSNLVTEVISCIGAAIEQECQMRWYEKTDPNLLQRIKENYWHQSSGTRQRLATTKTLMNRYEKEWQHWSRTVRTKLGGWLLDCLCQVSGWFTKVVEMHHGKRQNCIVPTPEFYAVKDQIMGDAEGFAPLAWRELGASPSTTLVAAPNRAQPLVFPLVDQGDALQTIHTAVAAQPINQSTSHAVLSQATVMREAIKPRLRRLSLSSAKRAARARCSRWVVLCL